MPQNLSPKLSAQTQKFGTYLDEKRLHWACILRVWNNFIDNFEDSFGDSFGDNFGDKFQYLRHRHVTSFIKDFTQKNHIGTYIFANASSFRFPILFFVAIIFCYAYDTTQKYVSPS